MKPPRPRGRLIRLGRDAGLEHDGRGRGTQHEL
jgi:hypothetical protein